jgi:hypothetical protein
MLPSACFIIWFHASFYTIKEIKFKNDYGAALQMRRSGGLRANAPPGEEN